MTVVTLALMVGEQLPADLDDRQGVAGLIIWSVLATIVVAVVGLWRHGKA